MLNQSLISYTLCYHPLTHFELLNLDEQSETQQARVVQRRLERNVSSFNFVLNFHFQPFFQLSFSYRYSFATKYNLYSGLPFSDHPLLAVNYQIPAIQTEQFMVTSRDVISIRVFNKKAHEWAWLTFNLQSSQVLNFYWSFQVHGENRLSGKSSCYRFSFSAVRNAISKATDYVTFGFFFRILVVFPPLAMRIFQVFSSHDLRWKISTNYLRFRMTKVFTEWHGAKRHDIKMQNELRSYSTFNIHPFAIHMSF